MELVKCNNLCKNFDNKIILKDVNLSIQKGRIVGLLGKNGMGKTTLIKLINDLLTPTSGEVLINSETPNVNSKRIISYLPERTYLDKSMKVSQIITFFEEFYDNFNKEKAIKLLKDLDLDINAKINKMSKGMQEKLQLILVMSREAELYILDEPLGGVDPATRDYIRASYYEIIANKKWGDKENYDICLDCSIGNEKVVNIICDYINEKNK